MGSHDDNTNAVPDAGCVADPGGLALDHNDNSAGYGSERGVCIRSRVEKR